MPGSRMSEPFLGTVRGGKTSIRGRSHTFPGSLSSAEQSLAQSQPSGYLFPSHLYQLNRQLRNHGQLLRLDPKPSMVGVGMPVVKDDIPKPTNPNVRALKAMFWHPISVLFVCFPLGIVAVQCGWSAMAVFWLNFSALIPLAKLLGDATEELDATLEQEILSGLINATFGNAVEMIITIYALRAGQTEIVKTSLLGSILSNMLLVLGMSFFFGGILTPGKKGSSMRLVSEKEQTFLAEGAMCNVTMLLLSCVCFALPTVFYNVGHEEHILPLSRVGAVIIMASYCAYLIFQLFTHKEMLSNTGKEEDGSPAQDGSPPKGALPEDAPPTEDGEHPPMKLWLSALILFAATVCTSFSSEYLVNAVEQVVHDSPLSEAFIGVILLPIVGNACEHMAAVRFAVQDRPGLSIGIAIGSSTQIALFVVPFSVLVAWAMGVDMTMNFGTLHTSVMVLSVVMLMSVVLDGRANWLEGWMLMCAYVFIGVMYWFVREEDL
mmetsp:Transcript_67689/g.198117  ORF Transcript_67689/g.198117 Transcript_67689/m.198117 type:complete len:491 (-) Transcript_67689:94-1566(-)